MRSPINYQVPVLGIQSYVRTRYEMIFGFNYRFSDSSFNERGVSYSNGRYELKVILILR